MARDAGTKTPPSSRSRPIAWPVSGPGTAAHDGGIGLGLSSAQRRAAAQRGLVRYAPRDGAGSIFTLLLPASDPENPAEGRIDETRPGFELPPAITPQEGGRQTSTAAPRDP